jgi:voltage-gated potassium channel
LRHHAGVIARIERFRAADGYARWDRWLAWPLVVLGLAFLVVLILPLARPMTSAESRALAAANLIIWAAFVFDYFARVYLSDDRRRFIRTHVLDLIVVAVPFLRPFRLLRLFAIVASTTRRAGGLVVRQVTLYVIAVALVVMSCSAVVVYDAERKVPGSNIHSLSDAFWWAVTTVMTVGYGDRYPVSDTGRVVASILMVTGIALVGTITAAVASYFVRIVRQPADDQAESQRNDLSDQITALNTKVDHLTAELTALRSALIRPATSTNAGS